MKNDKNKFFKLIIALMSANLIAKVIGMLREVYLAKYYGASMFTDAYVIANNIPIILFGVVGVALGSSYIPLYSEIKEKEGKENAIKFTNNVISVLLVGCTIITVLAEIFTKELLYIFAVGFEGETLNFAVSFSRVLMPCIFVMALMNIFGSYLQVNGDFVAIGYVTIPSNLIIVISTILSYKMSNIYILVIGTLIGTISQLIYYYPFIKRNGFNFKFKINFKDKWINKMGIMIIPVLLGEAVNEVNKIVDKTLVSGLDQGSISSLNYADKLIGLFTGVVIVSITTLVYPKLSKLVAENSLNKFRELLEDTVNGILLVIIPIIASIIIISPMIVKLIFQRGSFDSEDTIMTYQAMNCYAIGLIGISLRDILIKVFYALGETKTPMINGVICSLINIPLSICFIKFMGHKGAALATSIASVVCIIRLMYKIRQKVRGISFRHIFSNIIKAILSMIAPLVILNVMYKIIVSSALNIVMQFTCITFVLIVLSMLYIGTLSLLRCKEVNMILKKVIKRGSNEK